MTTAPYFKGLRKVDAGGATVAPDVEGRIRFTTGPGTVAFAPHARVLVTRAVRGRRVCARALGGTVRARLRSGGRVVRATLTEQARCLALRAAGRRVVVRGRDEYGHPVAASSRRARRFLKT